MIDRLATSEAEGLRRRAEISRGAASLRVHLSLPAGEDRRATIILTPGENDIAEHLHDVFFVHRFLDAGFGAIEFTAANRAFVDDQDQREEEFVLDIDAVYHWALAQPEVDKDRIGIAACDSGAVIATRAVRRRLIRPGALVLCGPRVEPCGLASIHVPSLLIVGGADGLLPSAKTSADFSESANLAVVPGAGHFFEEPGTMQKTAELAIDWFTRQLTGSDEHLLDPDIGGGD
jgi:putative phosphoribosyl transferase